MVRHSHAVPRTFLCASRLVTVVGLCMPCVQEYTCSAYRWLFLHPAPLSSPFQSSHNMPRLSEDHPYYELSVYLYITRPLGPTCGQTITPLAISACPTARHPPTRSQAYASCPRRQLRAIGEACLMGSRLSIASQAMLQIRPSHHARRAAARSQLIWAWSLSISVSGRQFSHRHKRDTCAQLPRQTA